MKQGLENDEDRQKGRKDREIVRRRIITILCFVALAKLKYEGQRRRRVIRNHIGQILELLETAQIHFSREQGPVRFTKQF